MLPIELKNKIINLAKEKDWGTPTYKIERFVGNSHLHPLHKVEQYLLEIQSRSNLIGAQQHEIDKMSVQIEIEEEAKEATNSVAKKKMHDVEIRELKRKIKYTEGLLKQTINDIDRYTQLVDDFNNSPEGKTPDGELYIDVLTDPVKRDQIEKDYWEYRLAKQAAMDMVAYGRIGVGNMEAIMQLPAESQNKALAMAYEVLIMNESRMNLIQDKVAERLQSGSTVSDIHKLMNMTSSDFINKLEQPEKVNVPLIQKR